MRRTIDPALTRALGRRVTEIMDHRGFSQLEMARKTGLTPRAISFLMAGEREPMASTLFEVARALGVSVEYLWSGDNPPDLGPRAPAPTSQQARLAAEARARILR